MSKKSTFAIHKALIGIGGEPKSVKRLRDMDLLIETLSALQKKSFLLERERESEREYTVLYSPVTISPHKSLNTSRDVISESDLFGTPESEVLEDETITKIICPPLKLLQTLISVPKPTISSSVPAVTKSSTSTQAQLLPSTSSVTVTLSSESQPPIPLTDTTSAISNSSSISAASSSSTVCPVLETTTTTSNTKPDTS
ncbi:uncharacterized protein TNCV_795471 [Trichonephila clavipes]|nr:uncharacterized protein TNCV_795471 [Trichonephila clavipes]